ncbi:MAG TPA: TldD/PmbA family protein [Gemmatimonadales bacterium]|nr:TldD/PmbA family protein [Gemmatimonadales bacterium]
MIVQLLEQAARRAELADASVKTDETLTLLFESGRLKRTSWTEERGVSLRVRAQGRLGVAGTTAARPDHLVEAALASAAVGEPSDLVLPAPSPLPPVRTHSPAAATASVADLAALGQRLVERLSRDGWQVSATVERSAGSVRVANSRGVEAAYDVTGVWLGAEVTRVTGDDILMVGDHYAAADLPDEAVVARLADSIRRRVGWAERAAPPPRGELPVLFTPAGSNALFLPVRQACLGKAVLQGVSPLGGKVGERLFDPALSLTDDPWLAGASGSRAIDDEGVVTRRQALIRDGVLMGFIYDLETAARAGVPATGHARRTTFGKPSAGYSNLVMSPGAHSWDELVARIPDGLIIDDLIGVGQGNVISGAFSHPVALAYRVTGGEVVGRVKDAAVAGNAFELLSRVAGLGREVERRGSLSMPAILLEGVSVAPR